MRKFLIFSIIPLILLFGCSFDRSRIDRDMIEDARELQALLPAIEAALAMVKTEEEAARTISNSTYTSNYDLSSYADPDALYAALSGSGGEERFPADTSAYMEDFYSTNSGNRAYVTLTPNTWPSPTRYQVNLYIYPLFSTTVDYIHESYKVRNDGWAPVDTGGSADYTAYDVNSVYYFDGLTENKSVNSTSYDTGSHYAQISVPDDPGDSAYDYPATISAPGTGTGTYSADVSSEFTGTENGSTISVREFYTENGSDISSISYVDENIFGGSGSESAKKTVRRYSVSGDTKTVRAKSVADVTYGGDSWSTTTLEKVDIGTSSGLSTYSSEHTISKSDETTARVITMNLTETAAGTDVLTGEMVYTYGVLEITYDVTLDSISGLTMERRGVSVVSFGANSRVTGRLIKAILSNGNEFTGTKIGSIISGIMSNRRTDANLTVDLSYLEIITGSATQVF